MINSFYDESEIARKFRKAFQRRHNPFGSGMFDIWDSSCSPEYMTSLYPNSKPIIFAGDSFTWGEGLELYQDTDKWIEARKKECYHFDLHALTDVTSIKFRQDNRFAGLVSKHYNTFQLVEPNNGGHYSSAMTHIRIMLEHEYKPACIILQHNIFKRNPYRFDFESKDEFSLKTNFRAITEFEDLFVTDDESYYKLQRDRGISSLDEYSVKEVIEHYSEDDQIFYNLCLKEMEAEIEEPLTQIMKKYFTWEVNRIQQGIETIVKQCEEINKTIPIYFIDNWYKKDSNKMKKFSFIKDRIIPLEDENGNLHSDWSTWFKSLSEPMIRSSYPLVLNDHPSLSAHKLIAKSIIQFLDKKDILFRKDYI
jgi:hypothetical protein